MSISLPGSTLDNSYHLDLVQHLHFLQSCLYLAVAVVVEGVDVLADSVPEDEGMLSNAREVVTQLTQGHCQGILTEEEIFRIQFGFEESVEGPKKRGLPRGSFTHNRYPISLFDPHLDIR
jgi:hypothetical protein